MRNYGIGLIVNFSRAIPWLMAVSTTALAFSFILVLSTSAKGCETKNLNDAPKGEVTGTAQANFETLAACIDSLQKQNEELRKKLDAAAIPDGVIVAFDDPDGCPTDWTDVGKDMPGHVMVAAVRNVNDKYGFRRTGGREKFSLELDHLPNHNHRLVAAYREQGQKWKSEEGESSLFPTSHDKGGPKTKEDWSQGKGRAINNMPPFVAFYLCRKGTL